MKRFIPILCAVMACGTLFTAKPSKLYADDYDSIDDIQDQHENEEPVQVIYNTGNMRGDQTLRMSMALSFPLSFGNPFTDDGKMKLGGIASLGYHYFLTPEISVGGDATFGFNVTLSGNIFNCVPILATVTYTPHFKNFEFPITLGVGFAWEMYNGRTYWPGLAIKPQAGVQYRITPSWAVGGEISYLWLPQFNAIWHKGQENLHCQFANIEVSARYYF